MYKHILVPVDSYEDARVVVAEAASLASRCRNCRITLMNVQVPVYATATTADLAVPVAMAAEDQLEGQAEDILNQASRWLEDNGIAHQTVIKWGQPATEICRYAEKADADLVMVGKRDKGLLEKLLQGSVSQRVVQNAPTNVLVVK